MWADLWSEPADPWRPASEAPWRPVLLMPLAVFAPFLAVLVVNDLNSPGGGVAGPSLLFGLAQTALLVAGVFRPVSAWWGGLVLFVVVARLPVFTEAGSLCPWSVSGAVIQAGALLLLSLRVRARRAALALGISVLAGLLCRAAATQPYNDSVGRVVPYLIAATVLGAALRGLRKARGALVVQEELTAGERARRTVLEERSRIARELHDVVAHHMSVISIQAQVAPHLVEHPSPELRENLASIRGSALEALTELRRILGVLRAGTHGGGTDGATGTDEASPVPHAPQPTLERLDELLDGVRGAGLEVTCAVAGPRRALSPGVELSAYRIVQESLSNVLRHAPGATVRIELGYHRAALSLRVTNTAPDQPVAPSPGPGHGLLGMRERIAMLDGELVNGPTPEGGYEVAAILPASEPRTTPSAAPVPGTTTRATATPGTPTPLSPAAPVPSTAQPEEPPA
ncbi:histidine kinase [Streptomyces sp. NPDC007088]|uniref:sensor histidine kinase n=1 Tax=Streptomyces sp. NPDC007088 TaxID=3364773 RepID=UPI0036CDAA3B